MIAEIEFYQMVEVLIKSSQCRLLCQIGVNDLLLVTSKRAIRSNYKPRFYILEITV